MLTEKPSANSGYHTAMQPLNLQNVAIELHRRGDYARFFALQVRVVRESRSYDNSTRHSLLDVWGTQLVDLLVCQNSWCLKKQKPHLLSS